MGWLWASSDDNPLTTAPPSDTILPSPSTSPPPSNPSTLSTPSSPQPSIPSTTSLASPTASEPDPTPSEPSPELTAFLTALRPPPPSPPQTNTTPTTTTHRLTPHHIHSTTLSCRSAFDTAFYCASLGGQFTSLYRYGSLRSCSQQWSDFWFCVRTNRGMYSDQEREARVLRRGMGREREKYGGGGEGETGGLSSEDVWEQRGVLVSGAFGGDYWGAVAEAEGRGKGVEGGGAG